MNTTQNENEPRTETQPEQLEIDSKGSNAGTKVRGLQIDVSTTIIATALPANSGHCMVSDAVKEAAVKKGWRIGKVLTDLQTIRFTDLAKKTRYICFTPRAAQLALLAFDQGVKPEPFGFHLRPVQIIKTGTTPRAKTRRLAVTKSKSTGGHARPIIHGGPSLPTTIGLRREFGLRQMGVFKAPEPAAPANA